MHTSPARPGRILSLTPDHVARVTRPVPEPPPRTDLTRLSDADRVELAGRLLDQLGGAPFWIFAYGSLIWKPAFEHVDTRRGIVHGWRRSFCLKLTQWRGTPEQPGLMLALAPGGSCQGMAYRLPDNDAEARMLRLLDREIDYHEDIPTLRWLTVRSYGETFRALTFYCAPRNDADFAEPPLEQQVRRMARAVGPAGSCAEYLLNTVSHLEALDIHDAYLWRLQRLVAAEIDAFAPPGPAAGAEVAARSQTGQDPFPQG